MKRGGGKRVDFMRLFRRGVPRHDTVLNFLQILHFFLRMFIETLFIPDDF